MIDKFDGIKYRLESWAESEAKPVPGLSHSSTTIEARMMETGCASSGQAVRVIPSYRPNASNLEIDQAVHNLNKFQRRIVYDKYVKQLSDKQCTALANRSKSSYYAELDSIYHFIAGWLRYSLK